MNETGSNMKLTPHYTDEQIITKLLAGEPAFFEILIRRYNPYLYKIGRSYHYNHQDTEDLMQDSFVDAYANLSGFEHRASFKTWLIRIMLNNCYKKHKRTSNVHEVSFDLNDKSFLMLKTTDHNDTQMKVMNSELREVIEQALQQIPQDFRMVFTLRELNGLNVKETAEVLEISEANVKTRLSRAKQMLRKEVEKSYSTEDIYEFNLIYCDAIVHRVMEKIKMI